MNLIQDESFWSCSRKEGRWQKVSPSLNLSRIPCNDEIWHGYTLPKKDPKNV